MNSHLLQDRGQTPCHDKPWSAEAAIDGLGSLPSERHVNMNVFPTCSPSPLGLCPACLCAKLLQSCLTFCNPMDCSPSGSSVHGILQARILEWVAMTSSRGSSQPRGWTHVSCVSCIGSSLPLAPPGNSLVFVLESPFPWYGHSHSYRMPYHPSESV